MGTAPTTKLTEVVKINWPELYVGLNSGLYGFLWQSIVTGLLHENCIKILGVERDCVCEHRLTYKNCPHDIDILVARKNRLIPLQLGTLKNCTDAGFSGWKTTERKKCAFVFEKKYNFSNGDFMQKKIRQTPNGGIAVIEINDDTMPDVECLDRMEKKCLILISRNSCFLHCGMGGNMDFAKEICAIFGFKNVPVHAVE